MWPERSDAGIGYHINLEFCQFNIQGSIKSEESSDEGHNLTYKPIQVNVGWAFNIEVSMTDITDSFNVYHEGEFMFVDL